MYLDESAIDAQKQTEKTQMNENLILFIFYSYLFDMLSLLHSEVLDLQHRGNHC